MHSTFLFHFTESLNRPVTLNSKKLYLEDMKGQMGIFDDHF